MCPLHKSRCVKRAEENYFFALSKYQGQIQARTQSATPWHGVLASLLFHMLMHVLSMMFVGQCTCMASPNVQKLPGASVLWSFGLIRYLIICSSVGRRSAWHAINEALIACTGLIWLHAPMPAAGAHRGRQRLRAAGGAAERGAGVGARGAAGLLHQPRGRLLGHSHPAGPRADGVRLVRRPAGLHVRLVTLHRTLYPLHAMQMAL